MKEHADSDLVTFKQHTSIIPTLSNYTPIRNGLRIYPNGVLILSELLIVFDEAKSLLAGGSKSISRSLRRAQRSLGSLNVVLVFTDTLSSIPNFVPATLMDSSYRPRKVFNLLPPFYEVLTYDAISVPKVDAEPGSIEDLVSVFSQGRPIWRAYYMQDPNLVKWSGIKDLISFARAKLTFDKSGIAALPAAKIAIMCIRCGIDGVLDHSLASDLLSSFMGTGNLIFRLLQ